MRFPDLVQDVEALRRLVEGQQRELEHQLNRIRKIERDLKGAVSPDAATQRFHGVHKGQSTEESGK